MFWDRAQGALGSNRRPSEKSRSKQGQLRLFPTRCLFVRWYGRSVARSVDRLIGSPQGFFLILTPVSPTAGLASPAGLAAWLAGLMAGAWSGPLPLWSGLLLFFSQFSFTYLHCWLTLEFQGPPEVEQALRTLKTGRTWADDGLVV